MGGYLDPELRTPAVLLERWFTLREVTRALAQTGAEVTIVQAASSGGLDEAQGVRVELVREPRDSRFRHRLGPWASRVRRRVIRRVAELAPDVIHVHGLCYVGQARAIASRTTAPILLQDHADPVPPRWRRWLARTAFRRVAGVAFTSREQAEPFFRSGVFPPNLPVWEVIEGSSWFRPGDQAAARAATGLSGDPCFAWVARLNAGKDPLNVLEAFAIASPRLGDWRLWCFYHDAPLLDRVRARIREDPRLTGRVTLRGKVPHAQVEQVFRAADFLVMGSHSEGSGFAVVEAMACGTPPLVTDIPALRRLTGNGTVGALSPPGDALGMAHNLIEWSGRKRGPLRRAARRHFERELSFEAIGRQLRRAYDALVASRHAIRS